VNKEDAEEYTQSLGQIVSGLGVPKALGLSTEQWVQDRLGGYVRMSISERREAVLELAANGHSSREIGEVLGVDQSTVVRDANASTNAETPKNNEAIDANASPADPAAEREREQAKLEENKRETLLRLSEAAYRGTVAWSVEGRVCVTHGNGRTHARKSPGGAGWRADRAPTSRPLSVVCATEPEGGDQGLGCGVLQSLSSAEPWPGMRHGVAPWWGNARSTVRATTAGPCKKEPWEAKVGGGPTDQGSEHRRPCECGGIGASGQP
jgi:hypothetical protein